MSHRWPAPGGQAAAATSADARRAQAPDGSPGGSPARSRSLLLAATCAALDIGSNSAHALVAHVADGGSALVPLLDESELLGLGDAVGETRVVGPVVLARLATVLAGYANRARALGAEQVACVGTEPLRRAADARRAVAAIEAATGCPLHVLDHHEEGMLMLLGATIGQPRSESLIVVDIGGGSSELVMTGGRRRERGIGLRLGVAQLTRTIGPADPPSPEDMAALAAAARDAVQAASPPHGGPPPAMIAVGGTAANILKLVPELVRDQVLDLAGLDEAVRRLAATPADEVAAGRGIRPGRVRLLPAGAAILRAMLERYGLDSVRLTDAGIREGLILAQARAGGAWRDRLDTLVRER